MVPLCSCFQEALQSDSDVRAIDKTSLSQLTPNEESGYFSGRSGRRAPRFNNSRSCLETGASLTKKSHRTAKWNYDAEESVCDYKETVSECVSWWRQVHAVFLELLITPFMKIHGHLLTPGKHANEQPLYAQQFITLQAISHYVDITGSYACDFEAEDLMRFPRTQSWFVVLCSGGGFWGTHCSY